VAYLDSRRRTLSEELEEEIGPSRGMTPTEHDEALHDVMRAAWHVLRSHDDVSRVLKCQEPPSRDFQAIWQRLHRCYLAGLQAHPRGEADGAAF
jgi:hypothetical protein